MQYTFLLDEEKDKRRKAKKRKQDKQSWPLIYLNFERIVAIDYSRPGL